MPHNWESLVELIKWGMARDAKCPAMGRTVTHKEEMSHTSFLERMGRKGRVRKKGSIL